MMDVTGTSTSGDAALKRRLCLADTEGMIISDEQARLAAQDLRSGPHSPRRRHPEISDDLMKLFVDAVENAPDPRGDRVRSARIGLNSGAIDSRAVASKMISRIISDSLR